MNQGSSAMDDVRKNGSRVVKSQLRCYNRRRDERNEPKANHRQWGRWLARRGREASTQWLSGLGV